MDNIKQIKFLSIDIVARRLDISRETTYRLVKSGQLKAHRFGKSIKIIESDLLEYIEQSTITVCQ